MLLALFVMSKENTFYWLVDVSYCLLPVFLRRCRAGARCLH